MSDIQGKVVDLIIGVLVLFIAPVLYFNKTAQSSAEMLISQYTAAFVENVCTHGYLSRTMYEEYIREILEQNAILAVEIEHSEQITEPVYIEDVENAGNYVFTGDIRSYNRSTYTDEVLEVIGGIQGKYEMNANDSFKVIVRTKEKEEGEFIITAYTGRIRDIQEE